jgi:hypothetical protein
MSEISEPVEANEKKPPPNLSHARILWIMAGVLIFGIALSLVYGTREFTLGLIIGGALAFVNYYWLRRTLRNLFDRITSTGEKPQFLAVRYFGRYAALGAVLMLVYVTRIASIVAVLLGLSAFAFAIVVEGFIRIFTSQNSNKEEL